MALDRLGMTPANSFALYVGDDITDEDGFRAVAGRGQVSASSPKRELTGGPWRPTGWAALRRQLFIGG